MSVIRADFESRKIPGIYLGAPDGAECDDDRAPLRGPFEAEIFQFQSASSSQPFASSASLLFALGYGPMPESANKIPCFGGWSDYYPNKARLPGDIRELIAKYPRARLGVVCGHGNLLAIDIDTDDEDKTDAILHTLPAWIVAKRGSKGLTIFFRYAGDLERIGNRRFRLKGADGKEGDVFCEILWTGRKTTIPPTPHAKTGASYVWLNGEHTLLNTPIGKLPEITAAHLDALEAAIKPWTYQRPAPQRNKRSHFDPGKIAKSRYEAWYRAGLTNAQSALSGAREGRPTILFRSVCSLGAGVHHGFIPKMEFEAAFLDACGVNGLAAREGRHAILATIDSGLRLAADDELPDLGEPKSQRQAIKKKSNGGTTSVAASPDIVKLDLLRDKNEKVIKDQRNFRLIAKHEMWRFSFNEFTGRKELNGLDGYPQLDDAAYAKIRQHCASQYACKFTKEDLHEIVSVVTRENRHHPVREYFDGLEWDGVDRLDGWLHAHFGAKDTPANNAIGRKTLIAAVRRVRHPGCQCKYMMVLEGMQDKGKSKALEVLCPDPLWFTDNFSIERHIESKRVIELTRGKVLVEIPDLDMRRANAESIKPMLSRNTDEDRLSYGRERTEVPRSFIFIGTCNELVLTDTTGNVRFWPVQCDEEHEVEHEVDTGGLKRDRDNLWAEAAHREAKGEAIHLTGDETEAARGIADARKKHEIGDTIHSSLALWASGSSGTSYKGGSLPLKEIASQALSLTMRELTKSIEMRIASGLRKLGFEKRESNGVTRWKR